MADSSSPERKRFAFSGDMRLRRRSQFRVVLSAGIRKSIGPLNVYALPNELGRPRLGLAVSRRVGPAAFRNRVKRRVREAFRLLQHDLPCGYDLVVRARPHDLLTLAEYQRILFNAVRALHRSWANKADQPDSGSASSPGR
ncbi:MAG: ribonuclease P protein component [Phycisphaerales bacterium]